tara:strand:+ start:12722 stop:12859 length:138 start_codon:yes stop_codon:yes gene_type:complete
MTSDQASPQKGGTTTPPASQQQQQGQTPAPAPQQGQPIYRDWASI